MCRWCRVASCRATERLTAPVSASRHVKRGYTARTVPIAVIAFDFDPLLRLGDGLVVRWQTVALAVAIAASLVVAGIIARRSSLRADDLLYLAVGAVPGAVVGGRIGQLAMAPEAFSSGPLTLFDPALGGLELGVGVVGGIASAAYVGSLLGAPIGRWATIVALPLLVTLGAGKIAMAVGGSGQGAPLEAAWATAYLGAGPWGSLAPALPSHPSQLYEGGASLALAMFLAASGIGLDATGRETRDGRALLIGIGAWAAIRAAVSTTWRDPAILGSLPVGGVLAVGIVVGAAVALVGVRLWRRREVLRAAALERADEPSWPDPETRAQF